MPQTEKRVNQTGLRCQNIDRYPRPPRSDGHMGFGMLFEHCPLAMIVKMRIRSETRARSRRRGPRSTVHVCSGSEAREVIEGRCLTLKSQSCLWRTLISIRHISDGRKEALGQRPDHRHGLRNQTSPGSFSPSRLTMSWTIEPTPPSTRQAFRPLSRAKIGTETVASASWWRCSIRK